MIKKIFAAVAFVAATPALAIPIQFDIAGTQSYSFENLVTGERGSEAAQAFTMQFVFETDAFAPGVIQDFGANRVLRFDALGGDAYTGTFTSGGVTRQMTLGYNAMQIQYADSNGTVNTPDGTVTGLDGVYFNLVSAPSAVDGSEFNALFFYSNESVDSEYIDIDDPYSPESLLTVALPGAWMFYVHQTASCDANATCTQTFGESWAFNINSITRTNRSVPEPGTLSLLALGLLGAGVARRRRARA